jgi:WXG100 family type VII secretion target
MPDEKMVYESMEAMAKAFADAQKQLESTRQAMKGSSKSLADEGLVGSGGTKFTQAFGTLDKKLVKLTSLVQELEKDIHKAVERNKKVVSDSAKEFKK